MREETTADVESWKCWKLESLVLAEGKKGLVQWVNPDSGNERVVDARQEAGYRCAQLGLRSFGSFLRNHVEPAQSRLQHWLMTPSPNHEGLLPGTLKLFCLLPGKNFKWPCLNSKVQRVRPCLMMLDVGMSIPSLKSAGPRVWGPQSHKRLLQREENRTPTASRRYTNKNGIGSHHKPHDLWRLGVRWSWQ